MSQLLTVVPGLQDDVVMGTLTVRENFTFSAALRLPSSVSQREKDQKVNTLIQELGLGRVADSKVSREGGRGVTKSNGGKSQSMTKRVER